MIEHSTIYKRTSTGAVQTWRIEQDGDRYRARTGQVDGKITDPRWTTCKSKNVGRANETSPEAQADFEVAAAYKKKLAQGKYHTSINDIDIETFFSPMLAHEYDAYPVSQEEIDEGVVWAQPKLDGIRCIANINGLWTRYGKPIIGVPHIWESLKPIFATKPNLHVDGELYNHELRKHLNKISGMVRKKKLTEEELNKALVLEYHVYDCAGADEQPLPRFDLHKEAGFVDRYVYLVDQPDFGDIWFDLDGKEHDDLKLVETVMVESFEHMDELNHDWVSLGYEGEIVRVDGEKYHNKRSKNLKKRKEFKTDEFPLVRIEEGIGARSGMAGSVIYNTHEGKEFSSGIAGGEDFYRHLLENADKYAGGEGTVRFFDYTEYGIPYLPTTHAVFENKRDV